MKKPRSSSPVSLLWAIFFIILSQTTHAQVEKDTLLASQFYKKADSLLTDRKLDSSIVYFKKALPLYKKVEAWEKVAACYNGISRSQIHMGRYEESLSAAKKTLKISNEYLERDTREKANALDNIGEYYLKKRSLDQALLYFKKALLIRKEVLFKNHSDISKSYNNMGETLIMKNEFETALNYLVKASDSVFLDNPHLSKIYNNTARIYYIKGDYKKAVDYMQQALQLKIEEFGENHPKNARYYNNIGTIFERMDRYDMAMYHYTKAVEIQKKVSGEEHPNIASFYNNIAGIFLNKANYDRALEYLQKSLAIKVKKFDKNHSKIVSSYSNIGLVYAYKGLPNEALVYTKKALALQKRKLKNDNPEIATTLINLASIYYIKRKDTQALVLLEKALKIFMTSYGEHHPSIAKVYINMGNIYKEQHLWEKALFYYNKTVSIRTNTLGVNHIFLANLYLEISVLYRQKKEYNKALEYSSKAISIFKKNNNPFIVDCYHIIASIYSEKGEHQKALDNYTKAFKANLKPKTNNIDKNTSNLNQYVNQNFLLITIAGTAKTYKKLYYQKNNPNHLKKAIKTYQQADKLINNIRHTYTNYQDKVGFSKESKEIYQEAITTQLLRKDIESLEKAFYYSEKSKANTLKELLNDANAKNFARLPENLVTLEKELRINKAFYQSKITEVYSKKEIDSSKVTHFENKLFDINRRQDSLTQVLEKNYPKYHQLKYKNDIVSVSDIQEQLDDMTTVVEFFTGDSTTYAFTISKHNISVQELSTPKLTEQIEAFRKSIIAKNTGAYKQQAYALYNTLIAPVKDKLVGDQLIMIPDGPLWHLNFDLLLTQNDDSNNPALLSYLLKEYAVTYANAANLLFATFKSDLDTKPLQECLAFSFSDSTKITDTYTMSLATLRSAGMDLPGTRKEIKAISDIIDGQYYFGSQAIEANFKSNAGQYNILHLALHGEVDNERPENSKLYFTKSKDTIEDNLLYSHELFALDIPAELTVLSACNTGSGKIAKGEGIMSLGTAFQYAGTKSLLLTGWEVSDQTTPELMTYFYTNLKKGMNKAKALQQAKLQYLATANINRTAPFYWGGFYLVGDSAPIHFNDNTLLYWILGISVLGILLLGMFWYQRKVKKKNLELRD